jgi:hypothetical protein
MNCPYWSVDWQYQYNAEKYSSDSKDSLTQNEDIIE